MKKIFLIPTIVFALFIAGCMGNNSKIDAEHNHEGSEMSHLEGEHHHEESVSLAQEVELDNGEKWAANRETNEGIDNMIAMVDKEESKEALDYANLKENLDNEFNVVLEKCTMTGESHDQLHNYLLPLKARFEKLGSNPNKEAIQDIKSYLLTYRHYFK